MGDEEEETLECARFRALKMWNVFVLRRDVCALDDLNDLICSLRVRLSDFPYAGKFKKLIVGNSL